MLTLVCKRGGGTLQVAEPQDPICTPCRASELAETIAFDVWAKVDPLILANDIVGGMHLIANLANLGFGDARDVFCARYRQLRRTQSPDFICDHDAFEHERARAVSPHLLQLELEPTVRATRQALLRKRWTGDVAAKTLELGAVAAGKPNAIVAVCAIASPRRRGERPKRFRLEERGLVERRNSTQPRPSCDANRRGRSCRIA
jgi:hypothetical protein